MTEKTIVVFRTDTSGDVTAVFPYEPASYDGYAMTCYVHLGQHASCSLEWYRHTRAATPIEYANLKSELENYGPPEAHYVLDVRKRIPHDARSKRIAEARRTAKIAENQNV